MCELIPQVESTTASCHLNSAGAYGLYDNSFGHIGGNQQQHQHQMNGSQALSYDAFMPTTGHHPLFNGQHQQQQQHQLQHHQQQQQHRYPYHPQHLNQQSPMLSGLGVEKSWETENAAIPAGINEEFISLKSNDFSISVYHRYNGSGGGGGISNSYLTDMNETSANISEPYHPHHPHYNNCTGFQTSAAYSSSSAFHGAPPTATISRSASSSSSSASSGPSSHRYMPPTPPSSEPGSPSQQQQQIIQQQSRAAAAAGVPHQSGNGGPIHTNQYLSSGETTIQRSPSSAAASSTRKQPSAALPPPFSNGKQRQQPLSHFGQENTSAQVPSISANAVHLSSSGNGTIPVPFGGGGSGQCLVGPRSSGKVSHSFSRNSGQQQQYNAAAVVAQITAASHGHGGSSQPRYNRRNNPELEKRRIHRCDYPG